jgi:hypothetical protein
LLVNSIYLEDHSRLYPDQTPAASMFGPNTVTTCNRWSYDGYLRKFEDDPEVGALFSPCSNKAHMRKCDQLQVRVFFTICMLMGGLGLLVAWRLHERKASHRRATTSKQKGKTLGSTEMERGREGEE